MRAAPPAHPLFDTLIHENQLKNDSELCRLLKLDPPTLSKIRNGRQPVTDMVRLAVMRNFGWTITRLDDVAPPAPAAKK